ncbi:MAG: S1 RNA-binding domain-containing protein, partial [Actinobacteria bacterium]|nr:S1 RNA-binding domain-containing protein [Actinomycetota bacterium]
LEVGALHDATITRVVDYGAFARLEGGDIIGLVHMSELSELPGYRPDELVTPGEVVRVKLLSIDPEKRRVALSVRQAAVI